MSKELKEEKKLDKNLDKELINLISPTELQFNRKDFTFGENRAKIIGISRYPESTKAGFLSKITNIPNTYVNIHYEPIPNQIITEAINNTAKIQKNRYETEKDADEQKLASISLDNMDQLLEMMLRENEKMGYINVMVMAKSNGDEKEFDTLCSNVIDQISQISAESRTIPNFQKECYESIMPTNCINDKIKGIYNKIMPISTFIGGFPFASTGFNDGAGYYLAKDINNSLIIIDIWKRGLDRINSNLTVTGKPGSGKSTAIKFILYNEAGRGRRIMILDPEREYIDEAKNLNGVVINVVGGKYKINPLQILKLPKLDQDEDDNELLEDNLPALARHMNSLEVFFKLLFENITKLEMAELKKAIIETYEKKNITFETDIDKLKNEDYPILSDLYELIKEKIKNNKENGNLKNLETYLYDLVEGSDQFLWNGHTNVDIDNKFIVFDTKDIQSASDNKKSAEYYNVITFIWNKIEENRKEKTILVADESYLMVDTRVPQTLIFMRNISKRIRKYEGSLILITHDVEDFLDPAVKQYGQSLLSTACYKLLFGTDGKNLEEETDLFKLTEAERDLLEKQLRGHAILIAGNSKIHANFEINDEDLKMLGNLGGR